MSTPDGDSAGPQHRHPHRCRHDSSTTPARTIHRRRRAGTRMLTHRARFSPRPTTLWPFAGAEQLPGTARLAGWLGRVIVTLVTGYTRPGDRVLLLNPPAPSHQQPTFRGTRGPDPYAGLTEAVWTVIRLGRGADTATATAPPAPDYPHIPTDPTRQHAIESASGPRLQRPDLHTRTDDHGESDSPAEHRPGDQFDLVITAVHPRDTDWLAHTDLNTILSPTATVAAITHSDSSDGRLVDPMSAIVGTFRSRDWQWLDHIAVLSEPLHTPTSAPTGRSPIAAPVAASAAERLPIRSVHHDLLLFAAELPKAPVHTAAAGETSDA